MRQQSQMTEVLAAPSVFAESALIETLATKPKGSQRVRHVGSTGFKCAQLALWPGTHSESRSVYEP